jgi:hypothetical protein
MSTAAPGRGAFSGTDLVGVGLAAATLGAIVTAILGGLHQWSFATPRVVVVAAAAEDDSPPTEAVAAEPLTAPAQEVLAPVAVEPAGRVGVWPLERDEEDVAVVQADRLEVVRVARILTEDPFWAAWRDAPYVEVPLLAQQMTAPQLEAPSVQRLRVQGLCDGRSVAWRIGWDDPTPDGNVDTGRFADAVAIAFPLDPGAPPMMGSKDHRVQILYWKALWQKDIDVGFQDVQSLHPNYWTDLYWFAEGQFPFPVPSAFQHPASRQWFIAHQAGNPMAAFSRSQPVEELVAQGWSTLTHQPHSATTGRGAWVDGRWAVVLQRPLRTTDPLDHPIPVDGPGQAAFAVWEGTAGNRGGRKHWTSWVEFTVRP